MNIFFVKMFDYKQILNKIYIQFFIIETFLSLICPHILPFLCHFPGHQEKKAHLARSPQ